MSKTIESFRNEQRILLDTCSDDQKRLEEDFKKKQTSVESLTNMMFKLNKESHLTDFYLDKVLPVQTFTTIMTIVRTIAQSHD